jgi:hypothetical protein
VPCDGLEPQRHGRKASRDTAARDRPTLQTNFRDTHADKEPGGERGERQTAGLLGPPPHEAQFHAAHHKVIVQLVRSLLGRFARCVCDESAV